MKLTTFLVLFIPFCTFAQSHENSISDFGKYNFIPGEKTLFEDNQSSDKTGSDPLSWQIVGGEAKIGSDDKGNYISVKQYYTKLSPKPTLLTLPDVFTIEYDTWLDAGYDGNPGVEIHLTGANDAEAVITPNRDHVSILYPGGEEHGDTPAELRGDLFYNKWNHIGIAYTKGAIQVYVNQFMVFTLSDCKIKPTGIIVSGNTSENMPMYFRNFRIAKDIPKSIATDLAAGKFITHAIRFDVNKAILKPESMSVLNEVVTYMKAHPASRFQIGGHTDSDGDEASNLSLSQRRAEAVKDQLIKMGIDAVRLTTKGFGESMPIDKNTTQEGKANNRRVEFLVG